jgi:hypothetical protein
MQKEFRRWFDIPSVLLLSAAISLASLRMVVTEWLPDLELVTSLTRFGLFIGFSLGYSRFKMHGISFFAFAYSLVIYPWQIYRRVSPYLPFEARLAEMISRIQLSFADLFAQKTVQDPILDLMFIGALFWIAALFASIALTRYQNGLAALLPGTVLILTIQYNDQQFDNPIWITGLYFLFAFLLLARLGYLAKHTEWQEKKVFVEPDARFRVNTLNSIAAIVLLLVTWNLPSRVADWKAIQRWWERRSLAFENTRENISNFFFAVDNATRVEDNLFYGAYLPLGERSLQGDYPVAIVQVPDDLAKEPPRYYWRLRSYDTYENGGWSSVEESQTAKLGARALLQEPIEGYPTTSAFLFTNKMDQTFNLLMPSQSESVNLRSVIIYAPISEDARDLSLVRAAREMDEDKEYTVNAAPPAPTVIELQAAGEKYPAWVRQRYLQLPTNLPNTLFALAHEITVDANSPYEKAQLITAYLRKTITYSDTIPAPPVGRDPLEWFLFTWQEGYCNYSASAEVLLLRAVGVPSRLVVGFAQGQNVKSDTYVVFQKDAHAWVEVYFPGIGWVEFEPTGNQTALIRPQGESIAAAREDADRAEGVLNDAGGRSLFPDDMQLLDKLDLLVERVSVGGKEKAPQSELFWGMIVLATVVAFFGIWLLNRKQAFLTRALRQVVHLYDRNQRTLPQWVSRWLIWQEARPMERAFHAVNRSLRWLGADLPRHLTSIERAELLQAELPEAGDAIATLLHEHEKTLFSPESGELEKAQRAARKITWLALKKRLQRNSEKAEI